MASRSSTRCIGCFRIHKAFYGISGKFGLCRYNGYEFVYYDTRDGLPDHFILRGAEKADDQIWYQTFSGELTWFSDNRFHSYQFNEALKERIRHNRMVSFNMAADQTLHMGMRAGGYHTVDSTGKLKTCIASHAGKRGVGVVVPKGLTRPLFFGLADSIIDPKDFKCYLFDSAGQSILQFQLPESHSLYRYKTVIRKKNSHFLLGTDQKIFEFSEYKLLHEHTISGSIRSLFEDSDGGLWVGTERHGLYYYSDGDLRGNPNHFFARNLYSRCSRGQGERNLGDLRGGRPVADYEKALPHRAVGSCYSR